MAALFLMCAGMVEVMAVTPLRSWLDLIPLAMGLAQMSGVAIAVGSTVVLRWLIHRAVVAEAEYWARDAAKTQWKGQ